MSLTVGRTLKGVSAAERTRARREQLRESCLDLIGEGGVAAATVNAVCARAGLTKRYFYESYAEREVLLLELLDELFNAIRDDIVRDLTALPPERASDVGERTRVTGRALIQRLDADRRRARLYVEAPAEPVLHHRRGLALEEFAALVAEHVVGLDLARPEARFVAAVVVSGTTEVVSRWLAGDDAWNREVLVDAIERMGVTLAAL